MQIIKLNCLLILAALGGCVTPQVTTQKLAGSSLTTDFGLYRTATYALVRDPRAEIQPGFGDEEIGLFDTLLRKKLISMGYTLINDDAPDFHLTITILAAKQGNAAARFLVGFGAGRGVFTFDAKFTDAAKKEIASFVGGQAYTGFEGGAGLSSADTIMATATSSAVSQIERFMRNGGKFLNTKPPVAPR